MCLIQDKTFLRNDRFLSFVKFSALMRDRENPQRLKGIMKKEMKIIVGKNVRKCFLTFFKLFHIFRT